MQPVALVIVIAAGTWLAGVGLLMLARPAFCLQLFERMTASLESSNWRLQVSEQGLRILAGAALVVRAPAAKLPLAFEIAGWALVASSVMVLLAPIRWHGAYGRWWTGRIRPWWIRCLSPVPLLAGAGLIYAAL